MNDPGIVSMVEVVIPTTGSVYFSTVEGAVDDAGNVYKQKLPQHPEITRKFSNVTFGIVNVDSLTVDLASLEQSLAATFRGVEMRGAAIVYRRRRLATGIQTTRFSGIIEDANFVAGGLYRISARVAATDVLDAAAPLQVVDGPTDVNSPGYSPTAPPPRFPTATSDVFALGQPVPIVVGATREHVPARYVEASEALACYRYAVCGDLTPAPVQPRIVDAYRGTQGGVLLVGAGEYEELTDPLIADITPTLQFVTGGGAICNATYGYYVTALTGSGTETKGIRVTIALGPTPGHVIITWPARPLAWRFRVYRDIGGNALGMMAELLGPHTTWTDTVGNSDETRIPPTTNMTGQHTLDLRFRTPQMTSGALVPILADIEATDLRLDDATRALWLFRRGETRDESTGFNWLTRANTSAFWRFADCTDPTTSTTGNNALSGVNPTDDSPSSFLAQFVVGPGGKPAAHFDAAHGLRISHAASTGLDPGTGSFRIDVRIRPDVGAVNRARQGLVNKCINIPAAGYILALVAGVPYAYVSDGATQKYVTGTTVCDGAWHTISMIVDRASQLLVIEVDGAAEASVNIAAVGSISNTVAVDVGYGPLTTDILAGTMDWLRIATDSVALYTGAVGKSDKATSAFNATTDGPLYIAHAATSGVDFSTTSFTVEAWIKRTAGSGTQTIVSKCVSVTNWDARVGYWLSMASDYTVIGAIAAGGSQSAVSTAAVPLGKWTHVALVVQRESAGATGSMTIYVNGAAQVPTTLRAQTPPSIGNTQPLVVGALDTSAAERFYGLIDEVRLSDGARTASELHEAWALGMQNPAAQARAILSATVHGPGASIDDASWKSAEDAVAAVANGALTSTLALVEQRPLKDHLAELLRLRGLRLALSAAGAWTCVADTQRSVVAAFGWQGGDRNNMAARPEWRRTALKDSVRNHVIAYRPQRSGDGSTATLRLRTAVRAVLPVGPSQPVVLEARALRTPYASDVFGDYAAKRILYGDEGVSFDTGEDAADLAPGDLIEVRDPETGVTSATHEVQEMTERGGNFHLVTGGWNAGIYAYAARVLPLRPDSETDPDYSQTPPPAVLNSAAVFSGPRIDATGARIWTLTVTWTNPTSANYLRARIGFKLTTGSVYAVLGYAAGTSFVIEDAAFDDSKTYDVQVQSENQFGLLGGAVSVQTSTTQPGAPATPTGLAAIGAGHGTRRWKWTRNTEKDVEGYDWQVYDASGGGSIRAAGAATGHTRSTHLTYHETSLARTAPCYLTIRAVQRGGVVTSAWTSRVSGGSASAVIGSGGGGTSDIGGGTVGTSEAAANAFTDPAPLATASGGVSASYATVISSSITMNGGLAVITISGVIDIVAGSTGLPQVWHQFLRGASVVYSSEQATAGVLLQNGNGRLPYAFTWCDDSRPSGSTTYALQLKTVSAPGGSATNYVLRMNVVEFKR